MVAAKIEAREMRQRRRQPSLSLKDRTKQRAYKIKYRCLQAITSNICTNMQTDKLISLHSMLDVRNFVHIFNNLWFNGWEFFSMSRWTRKKKDVQSTDRPVCVCVKRIFIRKSQSTKIHAIFGFDLDSFMQAISIVRSFFFSLSFRKTYIFLHKYPSDFDGKCEQQKKNHCRIHASGLLTHCSYSHINNIQLQARSFRRKSCDWICRAVFSASFSSNKSEYEINEQKREKKTTMQCTPHTNGNYIVYREYRPRKTNVCIRNKRKKKKTITAT